MSNLIKEIEKRLNITIVKSTIPPQGMGSSVIFIEDDKGNQYAVKKSDEKNNDAKVLEVLQQSNVEIAVPKLINSFTFEGNSVVILEKISAPLLESIYVKEMSKYIPSMIENLKKLHKIKSDKAGFLNSENRYKLWKDFLLTFFNNQNPNLNWQDISKREGLDTKLVLESIERMIQIISNTEFISSDYSLLHSDFNQRNLFVNPANNEISAIIDWGEAMYGDPIYDFARIRMYIWHFELGDEVLENYNQIMQYSENEKKLETLYWLARVIEYLAYYSEELNQFNISRINLHQDFLRTFNWSSLN